MISENSSKSKKNKIILKPGKRKSVREKNSAVLNKQAEDELLASEERFLLAFQYSPSAMCISTLQEGRFVDVNDTYLKILGYKREEVISRTSSDINLWVDLAERNELVKELAEKGRLTDFELRFRDKQGGIHYGFVSASMIRIAGESYVLTQTLDVTERRKIEHKFQSTLTSLRKAIGTTIQVLVSALESRDPYTAGHQYRTADLACAIAAEIGLTEDKIEGIHMAGVIHDIGKLSIPAEILSKPTKLINIEFSLIKEHSRNGYEILKNVESPWPLAQIVYQHHERMNGSGYPRHLKGDEILLEARILAVADVVEAMASHRPYRPALGINKALEEIETNRGLLYDAAVVDACLRLFREKGYLLAEV